MTVSGILFAGVSHMQSPTQILRFFLPKKLELIHFLQAMRSSNSFSPLSISLVTVAFSLVNLRNVFQLTASGVNTDASTWLLPLDLFRTYMLADLGPFGKLLTKQTSFLVQPYVQFVRTALQDFTSYFCLPQSHLQASTKCRRVHHKASFKQ